MSESRMSERSVDNLTISIGIWIGIISVIINDQWHLHWNHQIVISFPPLQLCHLCHHHFESWHSYMIIWIVISTYYHTIIVTLRIIITKQNNKLTNAIINRSETESERDLDGIDVVRFLYFCTGKMFWRISVHIFACLDGLQKYFCPTSTSIYAHTFWLESMKRFTVVGSNWIWLWTGIQNRGNCGWVKRTKTQQGLKMLRATFCLITIWQK